LEINNVEMIDTGYGGEITDTNWHHVAFIKKGDEYGIYLDGTQVVYLQDTSTGVIDGDLFIGQRGDDSCYFDGHIDQVRIIKKNIFGAAPVAGLTDTITEPTEEYTDPGNSLAVSRFNCYQPAQMDLPAFEDMATWCDAARVNPDNFGIESISQSVNAIIGTTSKHKLSIGDKVLFRGVSVCGMVELTDGTTANIIGVTDDNTFTTDLDTSGFSDYTGAEPKLLIHFDGVSGSQVFTDETEVHTITTIGDTSVNSSNKKFGSGSGYFPGTDDALSIPDHADWDVVGSNADDWTIDFFVKHISLIGTRVYISQAEAAGGEYWDILLSYVYDNAVRFTVVSGGVSIIDLYTPLGTINTGNWYHIAVCKIANEYGIYVDGIQLAYTQDDSTDTFADKLYIGSFYTTVGGYKSCLLYTSPSPRDGLLSRMPSSA